MWLEPKRFVLNVCFYIFISIVPAEKFSEISWYSLKSVSPILIHNAQLVRDFILQISDELLFLFNIIYIFQNGHENWVNDTHDTCRKCILWHNLSEKCNNLFFCDSSMTNTNIHVHQNIIWTPPPPIQISIPIPSPNPPSNIGDLQKWYHCNT